MSGATDLQTVLANALPAYLTRHQLTPRQGQICAHIGQCRTPALGGLAERCTRCDYSVTRYHSCRDRHCPKCQGRASAKWCERQVRDVLPVSYYHVVFTMPHALNPWVTLHPEIIYQQLFASTWATLRAFAAEPRRLGGQLGMSAVLHTWGQTLTRHVHLHCLVPGGVLSAHGTWRAAKGDYLFPVRALARRFRGHFVSALRQRVVQLHRVEDSRQIDVMLDALMATDWVVYTRPCLGHTEQVVGYLARYSHRIALSDGRLVATSGARVGLRYRDYRDSGASKVMWLDAEELLRRFLLHALPKGLMRIRHYGFLANRCRRERLRQIRTALAVVDDAQPSSDGAQSTAEVDPPETVRCPRCRLAPLRIMVLAPQRLDGG